MWLQLKKEGILQGRLINKVWRRFQAKDRLRLLEIMEQFDLICIAPKDKEKAPKFKDSEIDPMNIYYRHYYVPSLFHAKNVMDESDLAAMSSVTFFVDIHGSFTSKYILIFWFHTIVNNKENIVSSGGNNFN